ncbi:type VI secretion system tip protein VgrG [Massilia sp. R798]|uniref:Type VI secretion system tip protein VgrG n=2 Tax=Massilia soli TaxID=2792854 RepID=A0ABS7SUK6_9BURK|nr:type VI secretion system tip protein VgrG [Massilia soli]
MRLDFPFKDGPPAILLPNKMLAHEEISKGFRFDVEVLSDESHIPLKMLMGKMVTISLVRSDGSLRYFNGHITEFRFLRTDGGFAFYSMVLEPWLAFARLRKDSVSFHGKSVREITEEALNHYRQADWHMHIFDDDPRMTVANQYNETDYNYLHRRWEARGLHYWYEHRFDGHTLMLSDKSLHAEPIDATKHDDADVIAFRLFVKKAGMKMVAAPGDIDLQALSDNIKLLAKLEITHTANRITISAKEEVVINGGGSYVKFAASGIEHGTNGTFVAHAASHSLVNAKNMEMAVNMPPVADVLRKGRAALHIGSHAETAGRTSAGLPFKLFKDGAMVEQGQIDAKGNIQFAHELDAGAEYKIALPTGQSFDIAPGDYIEQHEINAGVGYHGYENPGGLLSEDEVSLDQDRIDANPWSSDRA